MIWDYESGGFKSYETEVLWINGNLNVLLTCLGKWIQYKTCRIANDRFGGNIAMGKSVSFQPKEARVSWNPLGVIVSVVISATTQSTCVQSSDSIHSSEVFAWMKETSPQVAASHSRCSKLGSWNLRSISKCFPCGRMNFECSSTLTESAGRYRRNCMTALAHQQRSRAWYAKRAAHSVNWNQQPEVMSSFILILQNCVMRFRFRPLVWVVFEPYRASFDKTIYRMMLCWLVTSCVSKWLAYLLPWKLGCTQVRPAPWCRGDSTILRITTCRVG